MSVSNLSKIVEARSRQFGEMLEGAVDGAAGNEATLKLLEAMFKYMNDSNKAIMAKLEEIDKKVDGK